MEASSACLWSLVKYCVSLVSHLYRKFTVPKSLTHCIKCQNTTVIILPLNSLLITDSFG